MSVEGEGRFGGLRGELDADRNTWVSEIDTLLERIPADCLTSEWSVNAGIKGDGGKYRSMAESGISGRNKSTVQFVFSPAVEGYSQWVSRLRHFWVRYETHRESEWDVDEPYGPRTRGPNAVVGASTKREKKYMVGGPLADVLVTQSLDRVVEHVVEQFEMVAERILFNIDIERFTPRSIVRDGRDLDTSRRSNPVSVGGVGGDTIDRLADHYGAYSNILLYDQSHVYGKLSTAWGNSPDVEGLYERVESAVAAYLDALEDGETRSSLKPEDLADYPQRGPQWRGMWIAPHTRPDPRNPLTPAPYGYTHGSTDDETTIATVGTVIIQAQANGCWRLSPSVEAPENADELLVPYGIERFECDAIRTEYRGTEGDVYLHDCYVALQILTRCWAAHTDDSKFRVNTPIEASSIDVHDRDAIDEWTVNTAISAVLRHLDETGYWSPTVWDDEVYDHNKDRTKSELAYILASMPVDMLDGWNVKTYASSVKFRATPDDCLRGEWTNRTNKIRLEYGSGYDASVDADADEGDESRSEAKFVLTGAFVDPIATRSVGRLLTHIETQLERVADATRYNSLVERMYRVDDVASVSTLDDLPEPANVLSELSGVGSGTVESLAEEHGTFTNLLSADDLGVELSYHFEGDISTIHDRIRPAIETCEELRNSEGWDGPSLDPERFEAYPKR